MAGFKGKVNKSALLKFQKDLQKLNAEQRQQWNEEAVKELAARLLRKVVERTPVGVYHTEYEHVLKSGKNKGKVVIRTRNPSGKVGGTLERGWTVGEVTKNGDLYTIEIINPVEYAPYVEFGHRTRNGGYVEPVYMLTISEQELIEDAPRILTNKLNAFIRGCLND